MKKLTLMALGVALVLVAKAPVNYAAETLTSLKPGVSTVDAFMARAPSPPMSGEEAVHIHPLVIELDKKLDAEDTLLGNRANKLGAQSIPDDMQGGDGPSPSPAQAMAMAQQMASGGGVQAMMMVQQLNSDSHYQAHQHLQMQRLQEAEDALHNADNWLENAKSKLSEEYQARQNSCPTRQLGELIEPDPTCIRSAGVAYQHKMHQLAAAYLKKVADTLSNLLLATKILVDERQEFAKKMEGMGKGSMVQGQVVTLEGLSIKNIKAYNDRLLRAVNTAYDLAMFKVDLGY